MHLRSAKHRVIGSLMGMTVLKAVADTSLGPDPYGPGFGFDPPQLASWGGWRRGDSGTAYAEWDVFRDESHGRADDRTATPDLGNRGFTSAWAGWNAGTFISSTLNLYSFSVPEVVRLNLVPVGVTGPTRVVLQVESQGEGKLDSRTLRLNGRGPTSIQQTYKGVYSSSMGPADLLHQAALWDFDNSPETLEIEFTEAQHTTIRQIAVDVGPAQGRLEPSQSSDTTYETKRFMLNLPSEELDATRVTELFAQNRKLFPQVWPSSQLMFTQIAKSGGSGALRKLNGKIKGLFYDTQTSGVGNRIMLDFYRNENGGIARVAECELAPKKIRRGGSVTLENRTFKVGTAEFTLNLETLESQGVTRARKRIGVCDTRPLEPGTQGGIPSLKEDDFVVMSRR